MVLSEIKWKYMYSSDSSNLADEFYKPAISNSINYKRITGYFSAEFLNSLADEIKNAQVTNNLSIKILCSPIITDKDREDIKYGYEIRKKMEELVVNQIENFSIEDNSIPFISSLIAKNTLDMRFVYTKNSVGMFHDKKGIFTDQNDYKIAFTGSNNETYNALYNNYESFAVLNSDNNPQHVEAIENSFDAIWNEEVEGLEVLEITDTIKEKLEQKSNQVKESFSTDEYSKIAITSLYNLHGYQQEAVNSWKNNGFKGLLEMATGTGKTITSLACYEKLADYEKKLVSVIVVPQIELLYQWEKDLVESGSSGIICSSDNTNWSIKLNSKLRILNRKKEGYLTIITTRETFISSRFQKLLEGNPKLPKLLIADEVHSFGSNNARKLYAELSDRFPYRLGVSATPFRKSEHESNQLINFFKGIVFSYSLKEAIDNNYLNKYLYKPIILYFDNDTLEDYRQSIKENLKIIKKNDAMAINTIERLTSSIANSSTSKVDELLSQIEKNGTTKQSIIYCAPGTYNDGQHKYDERHIEFTAKRLSEKNVSFRIIRSGVETTERKKVLRQFMAKDLNSLLAIKCLDQGINIPEVAIAYVLSSTDSPTEFIQRRGRILRTYPDKPVSIIYDFVMLPQDYKSLLFDPEEADGYFVARELRRMHSYNDAAENKENNDTLINEIEDAYRDILELEAIKNA